MKPEENLRRFVRQRLTTAAQRIFSVFQQNLRRCQDELQRQRQLLDVLLKPDCRAEPQQRSGVLEEDEVWRSGLEPVAGGHCDGAEEFVEQRICAAADDLWSLLESLFTGVGRQVENEGPAAEPPLLPVCKEEEEERSCTLTPQMKEEEDFGNTQDVEQQLQEEGALGCTRPDLRSMSHRHTGSGDIVMMSEETKSNLCPSRTRTHPDSQNRFVDEELTAAVDDIFTVVDRFLCTDTEKWEQIQRPLLDLDGNNYQSRRVLPQEKTQALRVKEEKVEKELISSQNEERLLLNVHQTEAEPHSPQPPLPDNSGGLRSCSQTGGDGTQSPTPVPQNKKTFKCETCGKTSQRRYLHLQHIRTHTGEKPHTCETCGNCFNQKSALNQHRRTHTGEKPFLCKTCGRTFSQASSLRAHRITHTNQRPHKCRFCGMTFALLERLVRHTRVHTDERPYVCQVCGRSFRQSTSLSVHLRVHSGERPYQCGFCGKGFVDKSGVNAHQKVHLGEKAHHCPTCGKFFRNSKQLKIHIRIHTGEKPFTSQSCGRRFDQLTSLQKHRETHGDHMTRDDWTLAEEDSHLSFIPEDCAPCLQTSRP